MINSKTSKNIKNKSEFLDSRDKDIPVFKMSKENEENGLKALEEHRLGKTHEMKDVDEFIDSL